MSFLQRLGELVGAALIFSDKPSSDKLVRESFVS
jgi:hypothetical protein